jgi:hypothetical protein
MRILKQNKDIQILNTKKNKKLNFCFHNFNNELFFNLNRKTLTHIRANI